MAKKNYVSFRSDQEFHDYLKKIAAALSFREGRPVKITDVAWRIIDLGRPLLEQELAEYLCDNVSHKLIKDAEVSSAVRSVRRALESLERVTNSPTL